MTRKKVGDRRPDRPQGKQAKSDEDGVNADSGKAKEPELKLETEVKTVGSAEKGSETPSLLHSDDAASLSAAKKTDDDVLDDGMCVMGVGER